MRNTPALIAVMLALAIPSQIQAEDPKPASPLLTPVLTEKLDPTRTTVYCPTFQAAWNVLCDDVIKGEIQMEGDPPLLSLLNKGRKISIKLPNSFFFADAGEGPTRLKKMNRKLRERFGKDAPQVLEKLDPDDFYAFAYLNRTLRFETKFRPYGDRPFGKQDKAAAVRGFGIPEADPRHEGRLKDLRKQVLVYAYDSPSSFIVVLKPTDPDESIVLARVTPARTLEDTVAQVESRLDKIGLGSGPTLQERDVFWAPIVELNDEKSYKEIVGPKFKNAGWEGSYLRIAVQQVSFKLDETGATVKSTATVAGSKGTPVEFREFVLDGPFLLYLKRRDNPTPYLVMWIGDTSALKSVPMD
jgi:hypothetical protein